METKKDTILGLIFLQFGQFKAFFSELVRFFTGVP